MSQPLTATTKATASLARRNSPSSDESGAADSMVSEQAHQLWHDFAAANGVSIRALVEVLTNVAAPAEPSPDPSDLSLVIRQARRVDDLRRRADAD